MGIAGWSGFKFPALKKEKKKIYAQIVRSVARELIPFDLQPAMIGDPIELAYNKPVVCQQFWQRGPLLRRTRRFFPAVAETIANTHCTYPRLSDLDEQRWRWTLIPVLDGQGST